MTDDRIVRHLSRINENLCLQNKLKILELKIRLFKISTSNQIEYLDKIDKIEKRLNGLVSQDI